MHLHYCMEKFISWNLSESENKTCGKCGMKESATQKGCCKDEVKQLKIDTDHQKSTAESFFNLFQVPAIKYTPSFWEFNTGLLNKNLHSIFYSPPLIPSLRKRTILYCIYRI